MDSSIILDLFSTKNDLYIGKDLVSDHELNNNWDYRIYAEDSLSRDNDHFWKPFKGQ